MRRRHLRSVLRIEQQVYPRPWSMSLFLSELALRVDARVLRRRSGVRSSGYAGLMMTVDEGHVTTIAVDPRGTATRSARACCSRSCARRSRARRTALTLEVRVEQRGAQELYRRFGFGPVGVRKGYYAETNEDALVMWAHEIDQPEYAALLDSHRRGIEGETVDRAGSTLVTLILGIETSCDETAAAVVEDGRTVCSSVVSSQVDLHAPLRRRRARDREPRPRGARRRRWSPRRWSRRASSCGELDAVAACHGPGLAGALLVGVSAAKALALATDVPYVGVNHLEAHLHAAWLEDPTSSRRSRC